MANHYFRISYPNSVPVFETCFRCTTAQAVSILRQVKNPKKSATAFYEPGIPLPAVINLLEDREEIVMEEVKAYVASAELKNFKDKNKPAPKEFVVDTVTIKSAYKDCGAKLKNFRDAPKLIAAVIKNSESATDPNTLAQVILIEVTKINTPA